MPSSTRQRSLSFGAIPPRSVRPRPASTLPPTANIANSTAAILDALDAGHQAAPDALDDGAGLGTSPQGGTTNAGPASPGCSARRWPRTSASRARAGRHGAAHQAAQAEPLHGDPSPESNPSPNPNPNPNFSLNLNPNRAPSASSRSSRPCLATRAPPPCRTSFRAP